MKKTFVLPLVAALLLAACSNPADSSSAYVRKGVPISWDMDLDGYEEAPKDSTYGINWIYMPKERVDADNTILTAMSGKIKLKPVEFHAGSDNFKFYWALANQAHYATGAYKCIVYFKNGEDIVYESFGTNYQYVSENIDNESFHVKLIVSHWQNGSITVENKSTTVTGADTFKACYGQY